MESLYEFLFSWADIQNPHTIRSLIIVSTGCALLVNWYGLTLGITNVLPHILYIPLILTAYFYPRWGVVFTACLSAIYGILVWSSSPDPDVLLSALARMTVFILIAAVVSYLSGRMQHDANLCQRLVSIVESSNDAVIGQTLAGIMTEWNSGARQLYGYTAKEVIGRPVNLLLPPDLPDELPRLMDKIHSGERIERFETDLIKKDETRIQVSLSLSLIKNIQGNIIGLSTTANDITEKKTDAG